MTKACAFIDGANLYHTMRDLGWSLDFIKLRKDLASRYDLLRSYYYTATTDPDPLRDFTQMLSQNGYHIKSKPAKVFSNGVKGNMDIELAIDMLEMARHLSEVILVSGDGDFTRLIDTVQSHGVRVTVISSHKASASELRLQADQFVEINDMRALWGRV